MVNKQFCVAEACKRIYDRALKLKVPNDKPITVFSEAKTNKNKTSYIDDVHIKTILQEAARKIYKIKCKKELSNSTLHSIRVVACVLLHAQKISAEDITFRLRWRSDTFRMYLRNMLPLAERHKDAIANDKKFIFFHVLSRGLFL